MAKSWSLWYGDRSLGCIHEGERVGALVEGETIDVLSAGALDGLDDGEPSTWRPLILFGAHDNDLGQIACLFSAPEGSHGMVR